MLDIHDARNASYSIYVDTLTQSSIFKPVFLMISNSFFQRFLNSQPLMNDIFRKEKIISVILLATGIMTFC